MLNHPKIYVVQQSINVNVSYEIEATSLDEAREIMDNGDYQREKIIDINVSWDTPWDVSEVEHWTAPYTEKQLSEYAILGI